MVVFNTCKLCRTVTSVMKYGMRVTVYCNRSWYLMWFSQNSVVCFCFLAFNCSFMLLRCQDQTMMLP